MKRVLLTVVLLTLALPTAARAAVQNVYLRNESTVVSNAQMQNALPALQAQVNLDFAPVWNIDANLRFIGSAPEPFGAPVITMRDNSDQAGALGYHDVCNSDGHGSPCGYAFAATAQQDQVDAISVLDHELLEMLADPLTTSMQKVGKRFYIQEVCDAPESTAYGYTRPGADGSPVNLSDFVTPFWFRPGHLGPFDFQRHITKPLQILPGGYISYWSNGAWHQNSKLDAAPARGIDRE